MWDVIVLIPDHCLSIYFIQQTELFTSDTSKDNILPGYIQTEEGNTETTI